ncbi:hypothetical protein [Tateyamaria sp.]|uniref:hypothetical protein n=1 Tax=Tateyamaria sp. TaxID=1929288 RepID=UPI00329EA555
MQIAKLSKLMILGVVGIAISMAPVSMAYADNEEQKEEEKEEGAITGDVISAGVGTLVISDVALVLIGVYR